MDRVAQIKSIQNGCVPKKRMMCIALDLHEICERLQCGQGAFERQIHYAICGDAYFVHGFPAYSIFIRTVISGTITAPLPIRALRMRVASPSV